MSGETNTKPDLYKHGTAVELIDTAQILETELRGNFQTISAKAGRLVEVKFIPDDDINYQVGYLEKWDKDFNLWIAVQPDPEKSDLKHYKVNKDHNLGWRLVNLNKE